jgi:hypothetical protein
MKQGLLVKGTAVRILALDLGKFKMVACNYEEGDDRFEAVGTQRAELSGLMDKEEPDVVVFETCAQAGWTANLKRIVHVDRLTSKRASTKEWDQAVTAIDAKAPTGCVGASTSRRI